MTIEANVRFPKVTTRSHTVDDAPIILHQQHESQQNNVRSQTQTKAKMCVKTCDLRQRLKVTIRSVDLRTRNDLSTLQIRHCNLPDVFFVSTAKARVPERDVARYKPAIQSTTYSDAYAWKAVDRDTSFGRYSCNVDELHSWWALDLVERFLVSKVIVLTDNNGPAGNLSFYSCRAKLVISSTTKY